MADSTTSRAPRQCPGVKELLDELSDLPEEYDARLANRIVRGWDGHFGHAVATGDEHYEESWDRDAFLLRRKLVKSAQSHLFDVRRGTALRFLRDARRMGRSQTILLSDLFGTLVIG